VRSTPLNLADSRKYGRDVPHMRGGAAMNFSPYGFPRSETGLLAFNVYRPTRKPYGIRIT